jgi:diguanylate cyclase (GGDEF)-like protein
MEDRIETDTPQSFERFRNVPRKSTGSRKPVKKDTRTLHRQEMVRQWILLIPLATAVLGSLTTLMADEYVEFLPALFFIGALLITVAMLHQRQLFKTNHELSEELKLANGQLDVLHRLQFELNQSLDISQISESVLVHTLDTLGAECGALWLRVQPDASPSMRATDSKKTSTSTANITRWQLEASFGWEDGRSTEVLERWQNVIEFGDAGDREHFCGITNGDSEASLIPADAELSKALEVWGRSLSAQTPSGIAIPLRWKDETIGHILLVRRDRWFRKDEADLLRDIALVTGPALENAFLYQRTLTRADIDGLTGLLNHRAVQERLTQELARSQRARKNNPGTRFAIAVFDLSDFKLFNDTYGHATGDEVLRTVSNTLRTTFRISDLVARYGGDEFLAILPDAGSDGAQIICQRAIETLRAHPFLAEDGSQIVIRLTCGIAVYPLDGENGADLFSVADARLYEAKQQGRQLIPYVSLPQQEVPKAPQDKVSLWGHFGVLDALITAIDNRDHYTRRHSEQVMAYALLIAREMNKPREILEAVRISGLLYDIGKIAVPDAILRKPGLLSAEEMRLMQQHCRFGTMMVQDVEHKERVLEGVQSHHEAWDGSGYPEGLKGSDIPWMGRLLALADAFAAMTTDRPYRKALNPDVALSELQRARGVKFDPEMVDAFARVLQDVVEGKETLPAMLVRSLQSSEEIRRSMARSVDTEVAGAEHSNHNHVESPESAAVGASSTS